MANEEIQIDDLGIKWIGHSTIQINVQGEKLIYLDPFSAVLSGIEDKADLIISTHPHHDHFDPEAINQLLKAETNVLGKKGCDLNKIKAATTQEIEVGQEIEFQGIQIEAVQAYNEHRFRPSGEPFHPKGLGMGVILEIRGKKLYYAGDTDFIPEMKLIKKESIDVAFLPIGGTYTMDVPEAAQAAQMISPKIVIPVHYSLTEKPKADPESFKRKLKDTEIKVQIL